LVNYEKKTVFPPWTTRKHREEEIEKKLGFLFFFKESNLLFRRKSGKCSLSKKFSTKNSLCKAKILEGKHFQNRDAKMVTGTLFWPGAFSRQPANIVPVTIFPGFPRIRKKMRKKYFVCIRFFAHPIFMKLKAVKKAITVLDAFFRR